MYSVQDNNHSQIIATLTGSSSSLSTWGLLCGRLSTLGCVRSSKGSTTTCSVPLISHRQNGQPWPSESCTGHTHTSYFHQRNGHFAFLISQFKKKKRNFFLKNTAKNSLHVSDISKQSFLLLLYQRVRLHVLDFLPCTKKKTTTKHSFPLLHTSKQKEIFVLKLRLVNILTVTHECLRSTAYSYSCLVQKRKDACSCRPDRQPAFYARTCGLTSSFLQQPSSLPHLHRAAKFFAVLLTSLTPFRVTTQSRTVYLLHTGWARTHHKVVGNFGSEADAWSLYYQRFRFNETSDVSACTHGRPAK